MKILLPPQPMSPNRHRGQGSVMAQLLYGLQGTLTLCISPYPWPRLPEVASMRPCVASPGLYTEAQCLCWGVPSSSFDKSRGHMRRFTDFSWYQDQGTQHTVWVRLELSPSHSANILLGPAGIVLPLSILLVIRLPWLQMAWKQDGCM